MRRIGALSLVFALAALAGCDSYPRDIEGTHDRVMRTHELRVGYGSLSSSQRALADSFVDRTAAANGAKASPQEGASDEALFAALEAGHLDLVMTEVAKDSPWITDVAVIEPLSTRRVGARELGLSAVARNGENRWVMQLESQARGMGRGGS